MNFKAIKSSDENVEKFVFETENSVYESVLYKYPTFNERTVMCVSTQSGCPVGCRFCGAGNYFVKSLSSDEIVQQVETMMLERDIDHTQVEKGQIMFMSMGEPMLNWKNVKHAIIRLSEMYPGFALLISTIAPKIDFDDLTSLSQEIDSIGLQFSIHETTEERRNALIPFKSKYTLPEIAIIGTKWYMATGRKPFVNYCATEENTTPSDVANLTNLFAPEIFEYTVSVVCEPDEHVSAANERQRELASSFMGQLLEKGCSVRMFDPAGQDDIGGGCGQLWFVQDWMKWNPEKAKPSCGFGRERIHAPRAQ